jgi:hypothetical protein
MCFLYVTHFCEPKETISNFFFNIVNTKSNIIHYINPYPANVENKVSS